MDGVEFAMEFVVEVRCGGGRHGPEGIRVGAELKQQCGEQEE
jgi:hypothetical protein